MSYVERLIKFMELKQKALDRVGLTHPRYFTEEDREALESLSEKEAKEAWERIQHAVKAGLSGLTSDFCPFCAIWGCATCPYARHHDECNLDESDWKVLTAKGAHNFLNNQTYQNILREVERELSALDD